MGPRIFFSREIREVVLEEEVEERLQKSGAGGVHVGTAWGQAVPSERAECTHMHTRARLRLG